MEKMEVNAYRPPETIRTMPIGQERFFIMLPNTFRTFEIEKNGQVDNCLYVSLETEVLQSSEISKDDKKYAVKIIRKNSGERDIFLPEILRKVNLQIFPHVYKNLFINRYFFFRLENITINDLNNLNCIKLTLSFQEQLEELGDKELVEKFTEEEVGAYDDGQLQTALELFIRRELYTELSYIQGELNSRDIDLAS